MSIIPSKLSLSDEEEEAMDENEPALYSTDIRKQLMEELNESETPVKMTRQSINHKREHMKVFLRIRPFTGNEVEAGEEQDCMRVNKGTTLTMRAPQNSFAFKSSMRGCQDMTHNFTFTAIHGPDTSQKTFFDDTILPSVRSVIDGQNCLVFTYGVTNAGKSYTIQGVPEDGGILPRSLDVIFNSIDKRHFDSMRLKPKHFCDVMRLTDSQVQNQASIKSSVLSMASGTPQQQPDIEPDSLEASDIENSKRSSGNSTNLSIQSTMSEDSLMSDVSISSQGTQDNKESDVTQRILNDIRSRIPDDTSINVDAQGPVMFSVWVSFAEIYNEYIYDLLEPMPKSKKVRRAALKLSEDKHGSIFAKGLKEIQVSNADEAYKVLKIGQKNLSIAATKLNHNSSRSHCIFSIKILRVVDVADPHVARVSKISFCDLAGSERSTKTNSVGDRLKEAGNINTSLLTLGKCIHALRYNQNHSSAHPKVIPFRESKLTRLFQSFFQGKGIASMIVNVNQCASMFDETMHVLKFSAIAKQVTTVTSKLENKWHVPKPKNKLISARVHSMVAMKAGGNRASVPWATPRTMAEEVKRASDMTKIDESIVDEDEEDELEETIFDDEDEERTPSGKEGVEGTSRAVLLNLVSVLKNELISAKQELRTIETQIRAEVCEEMAKQLVEIEASYNERLQEEKDLAEEVYEKKMEILTKSVKKTQSRRPRTQQEDREDYVPAMVHTALETKYEDLESRAAELESANSDAEKSLAATEQKVQELSEQLEKWKTEAANEKEQTQKVSHEQLEEVSSMKVQLAETEAARVTSENELEAYKARLEQSLSENELLVAGQQELTREVALLKEAATDNKQFEGLFAEREALKTSNQTLTQELEDLKEQARNEGQDSKTQLEKALLENTELAASHGELLQKLADMKESSSCQQQNAKNQLEKVAFEKDELSSAWDELEEKFEDMKKSAAATEQDVKEQLQKAVSERDELAASQEELAEKLAEVEESAGKAEQDLKDQLEKTRTERDTLATTREKLERKLQVVTESAGSSEQETTAKLEAALSEKAELAAKHSELVQKLSEMENTATHQQKDHTNELQTAISARDELKAKNEKLEEMFAEMKESTGSQKQELEDRLSTMSDEQEKLKSFISDLEEQIATVTGTAEEEKQALEGKFEGAISERDVMVSSLDTLNDQMRAMKEEHTKEKECLQDTTTELEEKLSSLQAELAKAKEKPSEVLEDEVMIYKTRLDSLVVENERVLAEKKDLENNIKELSKQIKEGKDECQEVMRENQNLSKSIEELEKKTVDLTSQAIELTKSKVQDTEESTKVRLENRRLNAKVPVLEQQIDELLQEIPELRKKNKQLATQNAELNGTLEREATVRDELFKEKTAMAEEIADLNQRVESAEAKVANLTSEIERLKQQQPSATVGAKGHDLNEGEDGESERDEDDSDEADAALTVDDPEAGLEGSKDRLQGSHDESSRISFAEQASTDTSRVEVDATPLMKRKKQRPARSRKRKSSDPLRDDVDDDSATKRRAPALPAAAPKRQTRGMRGRRAKTVAVGYEEQENIPEERRSPGTVSLTTSESSSSSKGALSRIGGLLRNSPLGHSERRARSPKVHLHRLSLSAAKKLATTSVSKSPAPVAAPPADGKRKKRKLFKTDISAPLECSPFDTVTISDAKAVETTRSLRSLRSRKKNTVG